MYNEPLGTRVLLTVDCDSDGLRVREGDVVQRTALVVPRLVPGDAGDVEVFTAVVLLGCHGRNHTHTHTHTHTHLI